MSNNAESYDVFSSQTSYQDWLAAMKVCPECRTRYEDHVQTCVADGAVLADAAAPKPGIVHVGSGTAPPEPIPPSADAPSRGFPLWLVPPIATALLIGAGVPLLLALNQERPGVDPLVAIPREEPGLTQPRPGPARDEPAPQLVRFISDPDGAEVWENDNLVCRTPCTIEHPAHVPLPRLFVLKREGYRNITHTLSDPSLPVSVELEPLSKAARPQPGPKSVPGQPRPNLFGER